MKRTLWTTLAFAVSACQLIAGITDRSSGGTCSQQSDCPNAELCLLQACAPSCIKDADCARGSRCLDTTEGAACIPSGQRDCDGAACPAGTLCSDGACRTPCEATDCRSDQRCTESQVCVGTDAAHDSAGGGVGGKASGGTGGKSTAPQGGGSNAGGGAGGVGGSGAEVGDAGMGGASGGTVAVTGGTLGVTGGTSSSGGNSGGAGATTGGSSTGGKGGSTAQGGKGGSAGAGTGGSSGGSAAGAGGSGTGGSTGGTSGGTGGSGTGGSTGGTSGGTGGSGTGGKSACATYDGALATAGASKIFNDGYGASTAGSWKGYAFSFTFGAGSVIKPSTSAAASCFEGTTLCASGSVPASDGSGAGIGWNINQAAGTTAAGTFSITGSIKFRLAGAKANMRISLVPSTGNEYCYTLTPADATNANLASGLTLAPASFKQNCFDVSSATPYSGAMIKSMQFSVPGSAINGAQTFDFCLVDIEPLQN